MSASKDSETGHVRDKRNGKWWWCHNVVIDQYGPALGPHGIAVYVALCRYANDDGACWPSIATIGRDTGMSPNRVRRSLSDLERAGLISIMHRPDEQTKLHQTSIYTLLEVDESTSRDEVLHHVKGGTSPREVGVLHHVKGGTSPREAKEDSGKKTQLEKDSGKRVAAPAAPPPPPEPVRFEDIPAAPPEVRKAAKDPTPQQALVAALSEATGMDTRLNGSRLGKAAAQLARVEATPDLIRQHYGPGGWWYTSDWRGQKGEFPRPEQVIETWGQWTRPAPTPNGNGHARAAPMTRHERNLRVLEEHERRSNGGDAPPPPGTVEGRVIRYG